MKPFQIENWTLNILERLKSGQPFEDSRVELKATWPEASKAARRIAGHANAAHGEPILWLIGVDEKRGVVGSLNTEFADWYSKVQSQFDGIAPRVIDINIPVGGNTIVALLFETDRAPFVVKNPTYGTERGEVVQLEVPWRENTSVRSATRSDLIKLLSPLQKLPDFEVINCLFTVKQIQNQEDPARKWFWSLQLTLYVVPKTENRIVIPFHRCETSCEILKTKNRIFFQTLTISPPGHYSLSDGFQSRSLTIASTNSEVIIEGPGMIKLNTCEKTLPIVGEITDSVQVIINLLPADTDRSIQISTILTPSTPTENELGRWILGQFGDSK